MSCADKFWIDDFTQLFCSPNVIPIEGESLAISLNKISRAVLLLGGVIAIFDIITGVSVLIICLIFIITFYYSSVNKDNFHETGFNPITSKRFCRDDVPITPNDPNYVSPNQMLVGPANPKTNISPIVAPPSHDITSWRENGLVQHSAINSNTNFDLERSGYGSIEAPTQYTLQKCSDCFYAPCLCTKTQDILAQTQKCSPQKNKPEIIERFDETDKISSPDTIGNSFEDLVPLGGINPYLEQISQPSCLINTNVSTGLDSQYKDNLLTQTLQPGVYQKSKVGEPINSLMGVSYTQQFVPTEVEEESNAIKYTQQNPADVTQHTAIEKVPISQTYANIYDPRFTGYGDHDRTYIENITGQPRFFYDDVDAIKMPNYITRNNVDIFPWATTYGPDKPLPNYEEHRQLANNAFHDSALMFRTDMQERLMRKRNAEMWQNRAFPKSTQNKTGLGMIKSCM
jgi:hypothetical protein